MLREKKFENKLLKAPPLLTKDDLFETMKLRKRQQFEEDRKKRIFNAKQRLFGLDVTTLEKQVAEKAQQRSVEAEWKRRYDEQAQKQSAVYQAKAQELEGLRRALHADLNYYRNACQRKEHAREYDLNDPDLLKKSKPVRIADDDPCLGVSSAQIFSGEDLRQKERAQLQREQQRAWLEQQMRERRQAEEARQQHERELANSLYNRDKVLNNLEGSERNVRRQMLESIRQYNCQLAKAKLEARQRAKEEENEDNLAEIYNMLTSDILNENPYVAQSCAALHRKIPFMYRGMLPEEVDKLREEQEQQLAANKQRQTEEANLEKQWQAYTMTMDRELLRKELECQRKQRAVIDENKRLNQSLAVQQQVQKAQNNRIMSSNPVSKEFFDQFNTTTR